ncbi:MAG: AbrB/MazE/SpoVT family DNA-binding domain-containing protein [Pyrinomonadaceae bacterium]
MNYDKITVDMQAKVLEKGHVVLPKSIRRELGIKTGDQLTANVRDGNIVLSRQAKASKPRNARIVKSEITGLPVIDVDKNTPVLTSELVRELLADFP